MKDPVLLELPLYIDVAAVLVSAETKSLLDLPPEEISLIPPAASTTYRSNFIQGRIAAHLALSKFDVPTQTAVGRGSQGEPIWPEGFVGSISHADDKAVAAVGKEAVVKAVGIDLQSIKRKLRKDIIQRIGVADELAWCASEPSKKEERSLMLFSAKECVFKAFFPLTRVHLGFADAALEYNDKTCSFSGRLLRSLEPYFKHGFEFTVGLSFFEEYVLSYLVIRNEAH